VIKVIIELLPQAKEKVQSEIMNKLNQLVSANKKNKDTLSRLGLSTKK